MTGLGRASTYVATLALATAAHGQEPAATAGAPAPPPTPPASSSLSAPPAAAAAAQQPSPVSATAAAPATSTGNQLQEIVVTAQRRSESLQNVPVSVTAVTAAQLSNAGIRNTQDLSILTPGLTAPETAGYSQPHIRGIGSSTNGPGLEQPVATYIDGVYIAAAPAALLTLDNIDRIEVLKGPQGTLFGRNATGGLIQVVTKDPSSQPGGDFSVSYGNYEDVIASAYVTGPLTDDLKGDIALRYETQQQGWGRNLGTGKYVGDLPHDFAGRVKLLYEPTSDTQIRLTLDYEDRSSRQDYFQVDSNVPTKPPYYETLLGGPFPSGRSPYDVNQDVNPNISLQAGGVALQVKQRLGAVNLTSTTAYRDTISTLDLDLDLTPVPLLALTGTAGDSQFSQEFQLSSASPSKLTWTTGFFYFHAYDEYEPLDIDINEEFGLLTLRTTDEERTDSLAAYAQATYEILPGTNFTFGGRYSWEEKDLTGFSSTLVSGVDSGDHTPIPDPSLGFPNSLEFRRFNYRLSLDHKLTKDILAYVSYNTGFKSGGFNLAVPTNSPYLPEDIKAVEGGLKTELFDRRVRLNVAAYHYDYENIQVGRYIDNNESLYNGARAEVYGVDLDGQALLGHGLSINGGFAYNHSRFTSFPNADYIAPVNGMPVPPNGVLSGSATGNTLPYAPEFTVDIGGDYRVQTDAGRFLVNVTYFHTSRFFDGADNVTSQPAYSLLNSSLSWTDPAGRYTVKLYGRNLTNTLYATTINETNSDVGSIPGAPRTYGITLGYHF